MSITINTTIPIQFEKVSQFDVNDTRFTNVKISLCHTEDNLNGSYFSKESIEDAISSLSNIPILGYIEDNEDGESDFSDHRSEIVREDGKLRLKYAGSAYGVIPESHNARFENKLCDDGIEREFLVCDGIIWNKLEDAIDILDRDGAKSQSMELDPSSISGTFNKKDKLFHFKSFKFSGAAILGKDYNPAMRGASIEKYSTQGNFAEVIQEINTKFQMYKDFQSQNGSGFLIDTNMTQNQPDKIDMAEIKEGGEKMADNHENPEVVPEVAPTDFSENPEVNPETPPTNDPVTTNPDVNKNLTPILNFGLTNSQLADELRKALNPNPKKDEWGYTIRDFWYVDADTENSIVVAYKDDNWELVGMSYTMNGDFPVVDFESMKRFKVSYIPMDGGSTSEFTTLYTKEKSEYEVAVASKKVEETFSEAKNEVETLKTQVETLTAENTELKEFKASSLANERKEAEDALFGQFAEQLSDEEIAPIREKASEFTIDELQLQLFALVGKKAASKFSVTKKPASPSVLRVPIDNGASVPKSSDKPYAHLIEEVTGSKK